MPEVSRFYGIVIKLYFEDHNPPHFHAEYGEREAVFEIATARRIAGRLPARAERLVTEWATLHAADLARQWTRACALESVERIDPLP